MSIHSHDFKLSLWQAAFIIIFFINIFKYLITKIFILINNSKFEIDCPNKFYRRYFFLYNVFNFFFSHKTKVILVKNLRIVKKVYKKIITFFINKNEKKREGEFIIRLQLSLSKINFY